MCARKGGADASSLLPKILVCPGVLPLSTTRTSYSSSRQAILFRVHPVQILWSSGQRPPTNSSPFQCAAPAPKRFLAALGALRGRVTGQAAADLFASLLRSDCAKTLGPMSITTSKTRNVPSNFRKIISCPTQWSARAKSAPAFAQGTSPWENAVSVLQQAFTSTIARGLSLVAIVVAGLTFAFGEGGSKRVLAGVLFGVGMAIAAVNFLSWLFPGN